MEEPVDLFEQYETLPQEVQDILLEFGDTCGYIECDELLQKLKPLGYTFEYGLSGEPYDLTKIN